MAKNMARIVDGLVTNVEWCSDRQEQTESLVNIADRPVGVGDTYDGLNFYRNGVKVLTPFEELQAELDKAQAELADADAALAILGVTVDE